MKSTKKLYYYDPFRTTCEAIVEELSPSGVVLNQTVAFPEGGGQEPDHGEIEWAKGSTMPFLDVQTGVGRLLLLPDFPTIHVDTPIYHKVLEDCIVHLRVGMQIKVYIDVRRRAKITTSHSAAHLVFVAVKRVRPSAVTNVKGCAIGPDAARFDFGVDEHFNEQEMMMISQIANELVEKNLPIEVYQHHKEPEAWYWKCADEVIPCGGTHLLSTGSIGKIGVRRRSKGKNLERISIEFPEAIIPIDLYHE